MPDIVDSARIYDEIDYTVSFMYIILSPNYSGTYISYDAAILFVYYQLALPLIQSPKPF